MRVVVQRVLNASVHVNKKKVSSIKKGLLVFVGFEISDNILDCDWIANKILNLRIFPNKKNNMELNERYKRRVLIVSRLFCMLKQKKKTLLINQKITNFKDTYDKF